MGVVEEIELEQARSGTGGESAKILQMKSS